MLAVKKTKQFKKDLKLSFKRNKNLTKLQKIMELIVDEKPLPDENRDHPLVGNWVGRRECHIEADWLLIYKIEDNAVIFERTGSHSDLFR